MGVHVAGVLERGGRPRSNEANTAGESATIAIAALSAMEATRVEPTVGSTFGPAAKSHANSTCASVVPSSCATSTTAASWGWPTRIPTEGAMGHHGYAEGLAVGTRARFFGLSRDSSTRTTAIGARARASSSWAMLTLQRPTARVLPSWRRRSRAPTLSASSGRPAIDFELTTDDNGDGVLDPPPVSPVVFGNGSGTKNAASQTSIKPELL